MSGGVGQRRSKRSHRQTHYDANVDAEDAPTSHHVPAKRPRRGTGEAADVIVKVQEEQMSPNIFSENDEDVEALEQEFAVEVLGKTSQRKQLSRKKQSRKPARREASRVAETKPAPVPETESVGVVLRLMVRDPSLPRTRGSGGSRRVARDVGPYKAEIEANDAAHVQPRPSRIRKAPRKLVTSNDESSSGSVAKPARRAGRQPNPALQKKPVVAIDSGQRCPPVPRKFFGQLLSSQLRAQINSMAAEERVPVCFPGSKKMCAGASAPSRKKLHAYFAGKAENSVQIFDLHGVHKDWYATPEEVEEEEDSGVGDVDEGSDDEDGEDDGVEYVDYNGQRISRQLLKELEAMKDADRVPMWHKANKRVVFGTAAPRKGNLSDFLERKQGYLLFDVHGRHKGCNPVRRRDKEREPSREPPVGRNSSVVPVDPLGKARAAAKDKLAEIENNVRSVLSSLRAGDPVAELRRELENEIDRVGGVAVVAKSMSEGVFLENASVFLNELEDLNVFDVFESEDLDMSMGFPTFTAIRVRLEAGELIGVADVWNEFCFVLSHILDYYEEGCSVYHEVERMMYAGGRVRKVFVQEHEKLVSEEASLLRMDQICKSAFQSIEKRGLSLSKAIGTPCDGDEDDGGYVNNDLVEQQEAVVKHKSNYRDEKGYSYLGKQQSAKVISFALYRPGFDGQARPDARDANGEDRFQYESGCHCCGRKVDDYSSSALCCSNILYGMCRKIVCFQCATNKLGLSDDEFVEARSSEVWCCFHCRGACCKRSRGGAKHGVPDDFVGSDVKVEQVAIELPCQSGAECESVHIELARRKANGDFGEYGDALQCTWNENEGNKHFYVQGNLRWGAYRCQIIVNDAPHSCFRFQVLPCAVRSSESNSTVTRIVEDALCTVHGPLLKSVPGPLVRPGASRDDSIPASGSVARSCLRWTIATDDVCMNEKDLPKSYHGSHIRTCSRTEGYDWRGAKLFPTVKWVGTPFVKIAYPGGRLDSSAFSVFYGSNSVPTSLFQRFRGIRFPRIAPGMALKEFEVARNTAMYHEMRKQLWGIVTGKSSIHGIGLFSVSGYRKGDFVIEYAGELIRSQLGDLREIRYEAAGLGTYLFKLNDDHIVDATVESNRARFLNHSCDPNMQSRIVSIEDRDLVIFVATRRIPPMGELTFDYQLPFEEGKIQCRCNSARCSGFMN